MTIDDRLSALLSRGLVRTRPAADMLSPDSLLGDGGAVLPLEHARLLSLTNGLDAYGGYFRLFGVGPWSVRDMRRWNSRDGWRSAWEGRADGWWCFGETAWGDQYAYAAGDDPFSVDTTVYRLDACRLEPEAVADDFGEFLGGEFARNAAAPRDDATVAARERFGEIDPNQQLAYVPSLLLGGDDDLANVVTLGAREAMAAAGEAYRAWAHAGVAR
ncbi:MAG TPA: hypothetical protein VE824_03280 [Gaiellales bacterium]|nr:hypothetical protein [Gaiellales bacterium]